MRVTYRIYANCTEEEVANAFIDFSAIKMDRSVAFGDKDEHGERERCIKIYEYKNTDPLLALLG